MDLSPLVYKTAPLSTQNNILHPALILLHGRGSDENDLLGLAPMFDPRMVIISVRAPYDFTHGGYTWFDLDDEGNMDFDQILSSRDALVRCLDEIQKKYPIDPEHVFLYGFSMGAMMSLLLSLSHPKRFKGVVAHSGMLIEEDSLKYRMDDLKRVSFFIAHGTYDSVVPVDFGRQAHQLLMRSGAAVLYREYPIQHAISDESLTDTAEWLHDLI
jgi:phospholipase/carboxylesterase